MYKYICISIFMHLFVFVFICIHIHTYKYIYILAEVPGVARVQPHSSFTGAPTDLRPLPLSFSENFTKMV